MPRSFIDGDYIPFVYLYKGGLLYHSYVVFKCYSENIELNESLRLESIQRPFIKTKPSYTQSQHVCLNP